MPPRCHAQKTQILRTCISARLCDEAANGFEKLGKNVEKKVRGSQRYRCWYGRRRLTESEHPAALPLMSPRQSLHRFIVFTWLSRKKPISCFTMRIRALDYGVVSYGNAALRSATLRFGENSAGLPPRAHLHVQNALAIQGHWRRAGGTDGEAHRLPTGAIRRRSSKKLKTNTTLSYLASVCASESFARATRLLSGCRSKLRCAPPTPCRATNRTSDHIRGFSARKEPPSSV
jgi:hypothetical protein